MDKNKDQLLDSLLKEHAKHGTGNDEAFLKELDERISMNNTVVEMPERKPSPGNRWALGTGIAACLALGFTVHYATKTHEKDTIAYHDANLEVPVADAILEVPIETQVRPKAPKSNMAQPASTESQKQPELSDVRSLEILGDHEAKQAGTRMAGNLNRLSGGKDAPAFKDNIVGGEHPDYTFKKDGSGRPEMTNEVERKPSAPSSSMAKVIAGNSATSLQIPIPPRGLQESNGVLFSQTLGDVSVPKKSQKAGTNLFGRDANSGRSREMIPRPPHIHPPIDREHISGEKYGKLTENKWTAPLDERSSLSTFAVDVDTASYANIRRMIREGQTIPKDSVRIEEMLNYFDYQYAQPTGKHPFAVHVDSCVSPWDANNRIVRVGIQGKEIVREERPATNLVFLLDVSGSMSSPNKLPLLQQSMKYLLEELNENDTVSIVVYAGASGLALPATNVDDFGRQKILQKMNSLSAGGSTAGGQGIKLAYKQAQENFKKEGVNRIILATDGDFNVGVSDNASLTKMVKEKAKSGTYISVLGFGSGNINDAMLESITNNGNGNYNYIDTIKEGRKVLLEDMMGTMVTIAKDVKVQVEMNPNKVKAYRLIGYANRMLPPEAFLDKKVDAGEIGAGHTVTALYEIIPADGKPFGTEIDASRYFKKPETKPNPALKDSKEMMFVKLAYKEQDQKIEDESTYFTVPFVASDDGESSEDLSFATSVGLFGMVLRDSENKGSGDLAKVLSLAKAGKGADGKGQRAEFIKLVEKCIEKE